MRKNLIIARIVMGLTQERLADLMGTAVSYVCEIESGKKRPSQNFQRKARDVLNNRKSDLFFNS